MRTVRTAAIGSASAGRALARPDPDDDRTTDARERERTERERADVGDAVRAGDSAITSVSAPAQAGINSRSRSTSTARGPPRQHRPDRHEEQQRDADRHAEAGEVRLAHGDLLVLQRLDEQREHGAGEHDEREAGEEQVVQQERGLARDRGVDATGRAELVAAPRDRARRSRTRTRRGTSAATDRCSTARTRAPS